MTGRGRNKEFRLKQEQDDKGVQQEQMHPTKGKSRAKGPEQKLLFMNRLKFLEKLIFSKADQNLTKIKKL